MEAGPAADLLPPPPVAGIPGDDEDAAEELPVIWGSSTRTHTATAAGSLALQQQGAEMDTWRTEFPASAKACTATKS